jgi:hypothetical protein
MCGCSDHIKEQFPKIEKKFRLADYFNCNWDSYVESTQDIISELQFKAVNSIRVCRTAALGIDNYSCQSCGDTVEIYHNCKNRFCPTCSWGDTIKWADKLASKMMALPHRHVVMTIPHALAPLVKSNGKELLNILLRTAADTFQDWAGHKYNLKIGVISVLHTFGETKDFHVHVHMIVSWGGIDKTSGCLTPIKGEYVDYPFLKKKFMIKFEDELLALYDRKELKHKFSDRIALLSFLRRINSKNWIIHLEPPMPCPAAVIRYIARYSKRACISEYKITDIEGEYISFRHKDYKIIDQNNKPVEKILRMHFMDFFPRLLQHVPLKYFRLVRYYGVYSTKSHIPSEYLNQTKLEEEQGEEQGEAMEWVNPFECTFCKQKRVYQFTIFDKRPREMRTEPFNAQIHASYIFKRAC